MAFTSLRSLPLEAKKKIIAGGVIASLLGVSLVFGIGFYSGVFYPSVNWRVGQTYRLLTNVSGIDQPVSTSFGDYVPYDESFDPRSPFYSLAADLSNIVNIGQYGELSAAARQKIAENGFVVVPQYQHQQIWEILRDNRLGGYPSFVTSDAVLHAFHVLYDFSLREVEVSSFWDLLGYLTHMLLNESISQYEEAPLGRWKDAALRNVVYFAVPLKLMKPYAEVPDMAVSEVEHVLSLIEEHADFTDDWFMKYTEDFTQFIPRGHYTRSETLERFFLAMMWYGRVIFHLHPVPEGQQNDKGMNSTAQAILVSLALNTELTIGTELMEGYDVWDTIYEPTAFFVGSADDLTPQQYRILIDEIYGENPGFQVLDNDTALEEFITTALELAEPKILSLIEGEHETDLQTMGLRFFGQRYIPDSYILDQLVHGNVVDRYMPKGLDVMSALGSERAWELLEDQKAYPNYEEQMTKLWGDVANISATEWVSNLYYLWLYSLLPILESPAEGHPMFMMNIAWLDKQLMTALGSWTELRHDTVLYAKQSYTDVISIPTYSHVGYVEPVPAVYSRLASLCKMTQTGLTRRGILPQFISERIELLHDFLLDLRSISLKELSGELLNSTDLEVIRSSEYLLSAIASVPSNQSLYSDTDKNMALVVDVHTDPNSGMVLQEAVGLPSYIYVAVPIDGNIVLTRGGMFTHYEFTWPMNDRLTDEAWQEMIEMDTIPDLPDWSSSFMVEVGISAMKVDLFVFSRKRASGSNEASTLDLNQQS